MKIAVCAICRNEVDYVEEWVSYYKTAGFDSVFIYDNVSDDGTSELLSALHGVGEITRVHWPRREGIPPQRDAYGHFIEQFSSAYDYVLICDIDEFLVVENGSVKELLAEAERTYGNVGAIAFPWLVFGSSGHEESTAALVVERFKKCEKKPSAVVKTMFCPKNTYNMRTHICDLISGVYLDNKLAVAEWNQSMPIKLKSSTFGRAVVHHYYTKSREEWAKRRLLPKADRAGQELKNIAEFDKYHNQTHQRADANIDTGTILRYLNGVRAKLEAVRIDINNATVEIVSVNKDWVFGVVHGFATSESVKIRIVNSSGKETIVDTKPSNESVHVFTVKTKWRDTFSEDFSVSIVGSSNARSFTRQDWPEPEKSIELLVKYYPEAEEHIFSMFIDMLEKEPSFRLLELVSGLGFKKYTMYREFIVALSLHVESPNIGYLKIFASSCGDDFFKKIADPKNRRRKYIVSSINGW
ncbi:glycosyltransferase family 2 protein [Pseudomonas sp. GL-B-19]|uniref:glycosyltransferase family 2 protein n=1 Tax=Pseudomonas sp. GL-B-19 TaxID=2832393 RepID=UPI001CBFB2D3|nr:glycosyltransferase family 2 protein [Pseudomonas sp. GL-B-19]